MFRVTKLIGGLALAGALAGSLTGCANGPTPYRPLGDGKLGFYEQPIENDRFRVGFVGKSEAEARDLAILRAAEIARERGYSHFEVLRGVSEAEGREGGSTNVGVGVGSGGGFYGRRRTNVGVGVGIDLGSLGGRRVEHSIEVKLRQGGSDAPNVFAVDSVLDSVGSRVVTES